MSDATAVALSPETVLAEMKKNGVTHVVWLPDSETIRLSAISPQWVSGS
jgi:sulfopyruvate decarboxylase subunit alpha